MGRRLEVVFQDVRKQTRGDGIIVVKSLYKYMKLSILKLKK